MAKDKDFLDSSYKMRDPFGLHDMNRDGHYDANERAFLENDQMSAKANSRVLIEDDFDDDDDSDVFSDDSDDDDDDDSDVDFDGRDDGYDYGDDDDYDDDDGDDDF